MLNMASSSMILRRSLALFNRLVNPLRHATAVPSVFRSFNTDTEMKEYGDDDRAVDIDRRRDAFTRFSDVLLDTWSDAQVMKPNEPLPQTNQQQKRRSSRDKRTPAWMYDRK